MPRKAKNYSKVYIYKIVCKDINIKECYVGHTTNFTNRKHIHKHDSVSKKAKVYQFIRENGGWDNWDMILIEICDFGEEGNELMARRKEREWQETLNATLNSITSVFENFEGETERFEDIEDPYKKNRCQTNYRRITERKELLFLRKKVIELETENNRLNELLNQINV